MVKAVQSRLALVVIVKKYAVLILSKKRSGQQYSSCPLDSTTLGPSSTPATKTLLELLETTQSLVKSLLVVPKSAAKTL